MKTLLVNLYGAPCSGKSVKMMQLCIVGKLRRHFCEISAEVAKEYVVQGIDITRSVQEALTREQHRRQMCFAGNAAIVITDAPPLIGAFYTRYRGLADVDSLERTFEQYDREIRGRVERTVNVYMWRDHPYDENGRLETECEDQVIANSMWAFVQEKHAGQAILEARSTDAPETLWDRILAAAQ